jgi:thiosulfate/3-mercaptopyruvate sulfurtransferase
MPSTPTSRIGSRDRPLIDPAALASRLGDEHLRVVDVRWELGQPGAGHRAYEGGHIPGAIFLDLDDDLADLHGFGAPGRHPLPSPIGFARRLEQAGLGDGDLVVAYDDAGGWVAARLWWMLDDLGFNGPRRAGGVAVLDGGWRAWLAAGLPVSTDVPTPPPGQLHLADRWTRVIDREAVSSRLGEVLLLDARAAERYRGESEPIDPVAGHIPTAISAPWDGSVDAAGRLLPPEALRRRYADVGAGMLPACQVVPYCGSGVTACHHALAMRVAGLPEPTVHIGSFSDWSRSGLPVATGPEPGESPFSSGSQPAKR